MILECEALFPFGQDSDAESIIQHLYDVHGYRTRITDGGKLSGISSALVIVLFF